VNISVFGNRPILNFYQCRISAQLQAVNDHLREKSELARALQEQVALQGDNEARLKELSVLSLSFFTSIEFTMSRHINA
jgi:hypothetical protein